MCTRKNIRNTLIYINLENAIFKTQVDEFTVRVAKTPEEIQQLLEVGFEYVCEKDSLLYFRKRKLPDRVCVEKAVVNSCRHERLGLLF